MFSTLPLLPADPILGLSAAYQQDTNPDKVDLGVGVYKDDHGHTPIMAAVRAAETERIRRENSKVYTQPAGYPGANEVAQNLIFGAEHDAIHQGRVRTIQTPGGCGALRVAGELIHRAKPNATVWVSAPTWGNHISLLSASGLTIREYPYYNYTTHSIDFDAMFQALSAVPRGDLVLLHAACHNPCGADLTVEQWQKVAELALERGFTPFIDMAYQGFGDGLVEDSIGPRLMANILPEVIVAVSFSKNFGLYRERAGALSVVFAHKAQADAGISQLLSLTRGLYSMPPAHGAALIDIILHSNELSMQWENELTQMRNRIAGLRTSLVSALQHAQAEQDFSFIARERGMFSFLGLSSEQVQALRKDYSIYMTDNSRINVAGLSVHKLDYVSRAIASVLKATP